MNCFTPPHPPHYKIPQSLKSLDEINPSFIKLFMSGIVSTVTRKPTVTTGLQQDNFGGKIHLGSNPNKDSVWIWEWRHAFRSSILEQRSKTSSFLVARPAEQMSILKATWQNWDCTNLAPWVELFCNVHTMRLSSAEWVWIMLVFKNIWNEQQMLKR